ncbi:MAG: lipoyl synthase [Candidatus Omnitrophica bacterium]|nr:lipoyl synthase [Candidatus Omnitrophota bacterium]MDD5355634.1 lipoyl synthase [Candidatus Omnitrophota bacterium]
MKNRLPVWFKQDLPSQKALDLSDSLRNEFKLNTVCHSAKCPNMPHCFSNRHATFMILGDTCTRRCGFCNVKKIERGLNRQLPVDFDEPYRIAQAVKVLNLEYVVITSVTRDDLDDGGAAHFVNTIRAVRGLNPDIGIEVLIPDFMGLHNALESVVKEKPKVISHNLETTSNIFSLVRGEANYRRSLNLLSNIKSMNPAQVSKSSIMLGLGEADSDLREALYDLRSVNCDMLVLGQYLSPSTNHYPVQKFYSPQEFDNWKDFAYRIGFKDVCAFPLARTSYLSLNKDRQCTIS